MQIRQIFEMHVIRVRSFYVKIDGIIFNYNHLTFNQVFMKLLTAKVGVVQFRGFVYKN